MARAAVALLAVAALALAGMAAAEGVCGLGLQFAASGATYDLSPLVRQTGEPDYTVTDGDIICTKNVVEKNYTYIFNVCENVEASQRPPQCNNVAEGPAVQFDPANEGGNCYNLGNQASFSLLKQNDPAAGVVLTYTGGDKCNHNYDHPNQPPPSRQLQILFPCQDVAIPVPTVANEPAHCVYSVTMPTYYGCPLECPIGGEKRSLCSGNGICGYDKTNSVAKCFCDTGFTGADCNTPADESSGGSSGAVVGLLVTVLIIALVLGVVLFFVIRMLRAYRQDAHNYMAMHNQDLGTQDI